MSDDRWIKPNRMTEIITHEVAELKIGEGLGPPLKHLTETFSDDFSKAKTGDPVWQVLLVTRTGLDKEELGLSYFTTEEDAQEQVSIMPVGLVFGDHCRFPLRFKHLFENESFNRTKGSTSILHLLVGLRDEEAVTGLCYQALVGAGVKSEKTYNTTGQVLNWVGKEHSDWMKECFGENWSSVAEYEYCKNHFPDSSLASLAAALFVTQFVICDDFAAGYLTKEIETIAGGTEEIANKAVAAQERRTEASGTKSKNQKLERLELLMQEIEALSGVAGVISEKRILEQAWENAEASRGDIPKTKKIRFKYEVELRSIEPFRSRYRTVFDENA